MIKHKPVRIPDHFATSFDTAEKGTLGVFSAFLIQPIVTPLCDMTAANMVMNPQHFTDPNPD